MSPSQSAPAVLLIRPHRFASNVETRASNRFQSSAPQRPEVAAAARAELDALAAALTRAGIAVHVIEGRSDCDAPDEVFPNNWISTHPDGTVVLYPMMAESRRRERRRDIVDALRDRWGYRVRRIADLSTLERCGHFLEGTGSLVLDRLRHVAYACLSPRTTRAGLAAFAESLDYEVVAFDAADADGHAIYHTNVMLSVGTRFAVVCSGAIADRHDRVAVLERLESTGRDIVDISSSQMAAFAANLLELAGRGGPVIALSTSALGALDDSQRRTLERHGELVAVDVSTIETAGGGSVRCMLAEVHLPQPGR